MKESEVKSTSREFGRLSRRKKFSLAALLALFLSACGASVHAQTGDAPAAESPAAQRELDARRRGAGGLLRALNLSRQQRAQIAAIRRETEPQGRMLAARLRQARRALDEAIYAADADESVVEERAREVGAAQAAVVRLRSLTELRIRRVLSPEQLEVFRRLQRETLTRRRMNRLPPQTDDLPGDLPADPPARFRNRMQRRPLEQQQRRTLEQQQQQRRLPGQQNTPAPTPAPREGRPSSPRSDRP